MCTAFMKKHFILLTVNVPFPLLHETGGLWEQFYGTVEPFERKTDYLDKLGENVWLMRPGSEHPFLAQCVIAAGKCKFQYSVRYLEEQVTEE